MQDDDLENPDIDIQDVQQPELQPEQAKVDPLDTKHQLKDMDMASIFVRNLEENTTEDDLKEYFKDCGTILKITLRSDKNTGTQYAYLQFQESSSVEDALMLSEGIIRGRKILVFHKRTNLRGRGRGMRGQRGARFAGRGRYMYAEQVRGRGAYRGGVGK